MMFGAGIGIGMLTYATGEPIFHFGTNPDVIVGETTASSADNVAAAMKWSSCTGVSLLGVAMQLLVLRWRSLAIHAVCR